MVETEFGELPDGWIVDTIGNRATIKSGTTPSRKDATYWTNGTVPWVKTGEVNYGVIRATEEYVTAKALNETSLQLLPAGTLLLAMYGQGITRGKVALLDIDATVNQACAAIIPHEIAGLYTEYLFFHLFHSYERLRSVSHGAQQQNLSGRIIGDFHIAIPPLPEQRRIATVLNAIQEAIAAQEDLIAAARAFKRSLMARLFTYGPGRAPAVTKETAIGEIPGHWEVKQISDVFEIRLGKMLSQKAKQGIRTQCKCTMGTHRS